MFFISNEMSKETKILTIFNKGSASCSTESYAVNDWLKTSSHCSMKMNKVDWAKKKFVFFTFLFTKI